MSLPTRRLAVLITAIVLTTICTIGVPLAVALHLLSGNVLAVGLVVATGVTWIIWSDGRRADHVVEHVDDVHAAVAYQNRPRVVRDGQR